MKSELNDLQTRIQNLLASPDYQPLRVSEIISKLKVPPADRSKIRRILDRFLHKGVIVRIRKDRIVLPSQADLVTGRIQMSERGFGFVIPETPIDSGATISRDIFISPEDTWIAMHGDRVVVRIHRTTPKTRRTAPGRPSDRLSGRIIRILERANLTIIGVLQKSEQFYYVVPDDPRLIHNIYVNLARSSLKAKISDRVVVQLLAWENRHVNPEGTLIEVIGPSHDPALDTLVIIKKFHLPVEFPKEVLAQADSIPEEIPDAERQRRLDLTSEQVVTIDPEDARDYDDALSIKRIGNRWLLGVHIADVSHYVRPGTPLDREARQRGNSVYLPDRVLPMLPPRLSNEICSLKEGVERLTQSVLFEIDPDGSVASYRFHDSIIRSSKRLKYPEVLSVLQASDAIPSSLQDEAICRLLQNLWSVASRVRGLRFKQGSLELDFPELKVYCNPQGLAERIEKQESDASHQLVEEFMILANEAVAAETTRRTVPSIYRIHEDPDPEKLEQYRDLVITSGYTLGDPTVRGEIQRFLKRIQGKPEEYILKLNLLRSLKRAQYSTKPIGHFGLAKENYTHFTSPIRRYADLVIHRSLIRATRHARKQAKNSPKADSVYDVATLDSIAQHCSSTERMADEAEKEAVKLKVLEYFERRLKKDRTEIFDALVLDVRNFGLFIELPEFMLSGMIHVSALGDDFYQFDSVRQRLIGKRTRRILQSGSPIRVEVARVDRFKKQVDFRLSEGS